MFRSKQLCGIIISPFLPGFFFVCLLGCVTKEKDTSSGSFMDDLKANLEKRSAYEWNDNTFSYLDSAYASHSKVSTYDRFVIPLN